MLSVSSFPTILTCNANIVCCDVLPASFLLQCHDFIKTWFFRFSIESVVRITGITAYMLLRSPKLGACAVSIVPLVAVVNKHYGNWLSENASRVQNALAAANSVAQETLGCIRTVVAFGSEESEHQKYQEKINEQYRLNIRQTYIQGVYYMVRSYLVTSHVFGKRIRTYTRTHNFY